MLLRALPLLLFSLFAVLALPSCRSTNQLLKARPVPPSGFFEQPQRAMDSQGRLPFQKTWITHDRRLEPATRKARLYIAPVSLRYLRPVKAGLSSSEVQWGGVQRREGDMANLLRNEFARAFLRSPSPRYRIAQRPGADTVTLELALVELNPTSPKGNAVKLALNFVVGPVASLGRFFTKGNMAIEGKVRDSATGGLLFQFADNESDPLTFLTVRDFQPYGHALHAVRHWADQFEQMTRTPPQQALPDSSCISLWPY